MAVDRSVPRAFGIARADLAARMLAVLDDPATARLSSHVKPGGGPSDVLVAARQQQGGVPYDGFESGRVELLTLVGGTANGRRLALAHP